MTASDWKTSASPLCHAINVLPLSDVIEFEIAKIVYCHNKKCLPSSFDHYFTFAKNFHSRLTKFSSHDHRIIPLLKTNRLQRSIKFTGPKIWNSTPTDFRKHSFTKFKKYYKSLLINSILDVIR